MFGNSYKRRAPTGLDGCTGFVRTAHSSIASLYMECDRLEGGMELTKDVQKAQTASSRGRAVRRWDYMYLCRRESRPKRSKRLRMLMRMGRRLGLFFRGLNFFASKMLRPEAASNSLRRSLLNIVGKQCFDALSKMLIACTFHLSPNALPQNRSSVSPA